MDDLVLTALLGATIREQHYVLLGRFVMGKN